MLSLLPEFLFTVVTKKCYPVVQLSWVVFGLFLKPKNKSQFFSNTVLLPPIFGKRE